MTDCTHPNHRAHVTVLHPDDANPGFRAKIEIACNVCRVPFRFIIQRSDADPDFHDVLLLGIEPQVAS